jgi:S-DNA-T family DNA segregation ATPase FtsK/SpoIIIE
MSTWGPSKKKSAKKTPGKRSTSVNASSRSAKTTRSAGSNKSQSADPTEVMPAGERQRPGSVRDQTPPGLTRSDRAAAELRGAVDGREHELLGLGMIGAGVLTALAVYVDLAGPLGRGIETVIGWLAGLGRLAVPLVLIAAGIAVVKRGRSFSPIGCCLDGPSSEFHFLAYCILRAGRTKSPPTLTISKLRVAGLAR